MEEARLCARVSAMEDILKVTGKPEISIGFMHHRQVVVRQNMGMKDVKTKAPPDSNTLYSVASLPKEFMATFLYYILAEKGLLWRARLSSVIPKLGNQHGSPLLFTVPFLDILPHRTGLTSLPSKFDLGFEYWYSNALSPSAAAQLSGLQTPPGGSESCAEGSSAHSACTEPLRQYRSTILTTTCPSCGDEKWVNS